jgi:Ras-related protein Rab-21
VYDITDRPSFERVQRWVKELRKMVGDRNKICLIVVGNKLDLSRQRAVDADDAEAYAKSVDAEFIEVSAKTGTLVEEIFVKLTIGE